MAIKIVRAVDLPNNGGIQLTADLDAGNAEPADGDRLLSLTYGSFESSANPGESRAQYRNRVKNEFRSMCRLATQRGAETASDIPSLIGQDIT